MLSKEDLLRIAGLVSGQQCHHAHHPRHEGYCDAPLPGHPFFDLMGAQAQALQGPYVYEVWSGAEGEGGVPLYIGVKTGRGERPFDPQHHVLGQGFKWKDNYVLRISPMPSAEIARWVEKVLISNAMETSPDSLLNQQPAYPEDLDAAFAAARPAPPSDQPMPLGAYLIDEPEAAKVLDVPVPTAAEIEVAELERMLEPQDQAGGS